MAKYRWTFSSIIPILFVVPVLSAQPSHAEETRVSVMDLWSLPDTSLSVFETGPLLGLGLDDGHDGREHQGLTGVAGIPLTPERDVVLQFSGGSDGAQGRSGMRGGVALRLRF